MTQTQQQIIFDLTKEFESINKKAPAKGKLIDISLILDEVHQDDTTRQLVSINNKAQTDAVWDMLYNDIKIMNDDLAPLGLIVKPMYEKYNAHTKCGLVISCGLHRLEITYHMKYTNVRLINKQDIKSYQGFKCVSGYLECSSWENTYETLQELVESTYFKQKIRFMYESTLKKN
jgi:hypothetical protein